MYFCEGFSSELSGKKDKASKVPSSFLLISYVVTKKFLGLMWKIWNEHLIKHVSNCVSSQLYFIHANMNLRVYCNITSSKKVNYSLLKSVNNKLLSWSFIWVISEKAILYFESVEQ